MKGRHELDSCSEEGDPVQLFLEIRLGLFINLDISYLHNFKRWFYDSIWMDQVLIIKWNFVRKAELQELLLGEKDIGAGYCRGVGGNVVHFIVAISYVIVPEQYNGRINAESFFSFLLEHFPRMLKKTQSQNFFKEYFESHLSLMGGWHLKIYHCIMYHGFT